MKGIAEVQAGVCGFTTTIEATATDEMVSFSFTTDCQKIQGLANAFQGKTVDAYEEIHKGHDGEVMCTIRANLSGCCAGCAVPVVTDAGLAMKRVCVDGPVFDANAVYPPAA